MEIIPYLQYGGHRAVATGPALMLPRPLFDGGGGVGKKVIVVYLMLCLSEATSRSKSALICCFVMGKLLLVRTCLRTHS